MPPYYLRRVVINVLRSSSAQLLNASNLLQRTCRCRRRLCRFAGWRVDRLLSGSRSGYLSSTARPVQGQVQTQPEASGHLTAGRLYDPSPRQVFRFSRLIEPEDGSLVFYADLDGDGTMSDKERFELLRGEDDSPYILQTTLQLPMTTRSSRAPGLHSIFQRRSMGRVKRRRASGDAVKGGLCQRQSRYRRQTNVG